MTTASSLRSGGSLLGDPPGALCLSTVFIWLSSVWSQKDYRTEANALHLKHDLGELLVKCPHLLPGTEVSRDRSYLWVDGDCRVETGNELVQVTGHPQRLCHVSS
jgi:hypothetical protein